MSNNKRLFCEYCSKPTKKYYKIKKIDIEKSIIYDQITNKSDTKIKYKKISIKEKLCKRCYRNRK